MKIMIKSICLGITLLTLSSVIVPSVVMAQEAVKEINYQENKERVAFNESWNTGAFTNNTLSNNDLLYLDDFENSNLNTNLNDGDKYTLTAEDEKNIEKAIDYVLAEEGDEPLIFNPNSLVETYGFGKKWWNKRQFVGNVIDAALLVLGIWNGARSAKAAMNIIRANRVNITRVVEKQVAKRIGISVKNILSGAFNFIGTISGYFSVGSLIALGLDWADRKYDGFIYA